jgi:hypothetical protein
MKRLFTMTPMLAASGAVQAHAADLPLLQHALEHGWLTLLIVPALLLLLPLGRERRR